MDDSIEHLQKTKKLYLLIGIILFIFTVVTVAVATVPALDFGRHGFDSIDAIIGLAIASFKASLVMLIFMHLNHEKKLVYFFFALGIVFTIALMGLTAWDYSNEIEYGEGTLMNEKSGFYNPPTLEE